MKKILVIGVFAVVLLSGALLLAENKAVEEDYDEDTYGPKDPVVWVKPAKSVIFYHKVHTMEAGLECDSCHDDLFEMEAGAAQENEDFTMATLYDGGYCGACHDGSTAFASNTRCTVCHIGVRGHNRLQGDAGATKKGH